MNPRDASRALRKLLPDQPRKMLPVNLICRAVDRDLESTTTWMSKAERNQAFHLRRQAFERVLWANGWRYNIRWDAYVYRPGGRN